MASVPTQTLRRVAGRPVPPGLPVDRTGLVHRLFTRTGYLLAAFPLAVLSFSLLVAGLSAGISSLTALVGIPILAGTLLTGRGLATVQRSLAGRVAPDVAESALVASPTPATAGWRRFLVPFRSPQTWLDTLHGLVVFPVATFTFSVVVSWWAAALSGLLYPLWSWALPADNRGLAWVLGFRAPWQDTVTTMALGLVGAVTLVPVVAGLTRVQVGLARLLLANPVQLRRRVAALEASNRAVVDAEVDSLRRLERDLHDGPQQRLVRLQMDLGSARRRVTGDPETERLLAGALAQTKDALAELRALSRGIAPPVLTDRGLQAALGSLAARSTVPVDLSVDLRERRLPARTETALYFVVAEALTNVAKHSGATRCDVDVWDDATSVHAVVTDDGIGGAALAKGTGLAGLSDRLVGLDGVLDVTSPPGGPTQVAAALPVGPVAPVGPLGPVERAR